MASERDDLEEYLDEHRARRATLGSAAAPAEVAVTHSLAETAPTVVDRMFADGTPPPIASPPPIAPPTTLGPATLPADRGLLSRSFLEGLPTRSLSHRRRGRVSRATGNTSLLGVEEVVFPALTSLRAMREASFVFAGAAGTEAFETAPIDFEARAWTHRLVFAGSARGPFGPPHLELFTPRLSGAALVLGRFARSIRGMAPVRIVALTWLDEHGRVPAHAYGLLQHHNEPVVVRAPTVWFGLGYGTGFDELFYYLQVPEQQRWFTLRVPSGWPPRANP